MLCSTNMAVLLVSGGIGVVFVVFPVELREQLTLFTRKMCLLHLQKLVRLDKSLKV